MLPIWLQIPIISLRTSHPATNSWMRNPPLQWGCKIRYFRIPFCEPRPSIWVRVLFIITCLFPYRTDIISCPYIDPLRLFRPDADHTTPMDIDSIAPAAAAVGVLKMSATQNQMLFAPHAPSSSKSASNISPAQTGWWRGGSEKREWIPIVSCCRVL